MKENRQTKKTRVSFLSSIKMKITALVICVVAASVVLSLAVMLPRIQENMSSTIKSYMKDAAVIAGNGIEREMAVTSRAKILTPEELEKSVGDISVRDMASSYAYVVAGDGIMMYHPTPEKIGELVENEAVTGLVGELKQGNKPEPDVITYEFDGERKYASYYIGEQSDYIIVITADETEVFADIQRIMNRYIQAAVISVVLFSILAFVFAALLVRPIEKTTEVIGIISEMDFRQNEKQLKIAKRRDESGAMGRSINALREELVAVTGQIVNHSKELHDSSNVLSDSASQTAIAVDQVEKAVAEIAQGASSQAQETQSATENIIVMGNMIEEANVEVENLRSNARIMRDAGNVAVDILKELSVVNQKTKDAMQVIYQQTNVTNESAMKIKAAIDIITDIAEETNLLSLNASIEAARAGEQGRGFAVVAAQIQKLAEQSNESARQIEEIINILIGESQKSVETMEEVKAVIEKQDENVLKTENAFQDMKTGIDNSIQGIRNITQRTKGLDEARVKVVDVVQNLTAIAQENAASTEETSASVVEVGSIMSTIADNAKQLNQIAEKLDESVQKFIIE